MTDKSILPKIERKLNAFLSEERGSISKQSVISVGSILAASATLALLAKPVTAQQAAPQPPDPGCSPNTSNNVGHSNNLSFSESPQQLYVSHSNSDPFHCNHSNSVAPAPVFSGHRHNNNFFHKVFGT